ncbi:MAG: TIGR00730 family Rossman fold protein [Lachnospiraceae bacterium]|nr:TIGR00730 family Rossman fold protein [Lachnospiraceae bacterium]
MNVVVYCGANPGRDSRFTAIAWELGAWIADNGHRLVYGGSDCGLMGTLAQAALDHGGEVIGVEPRFFIESGIGQPALTELHVVDTMSERKMMMYGLGEAFVALPGGTGTLEEIAEVLSLAKLGKHAHPCIFYNFEGYYEPLRTLFQTMVRQGFLTEKELKLARFAPDLASVSAIIEAAAP